jgi:SAM-dependent methyltransferase
MLNPRPAPEEMTRFYQSDFLFSTERVSKSLVGRIAARVQELNLRSEVNWIKRHLPVGGAFLDYSAGNGQILFSVKKRRPDALYYATEWSDAFRECIGAKRDIDHFDPSLKFDLISAFGVLEHVEDPEELLHRFVERLKPGGQILISVPNPDSLQRIIFGPRWYSWLAPRHFHLMPAKTILRMAGRVGLRATEEKGFFLRTCPGTFVLSLFSGLDPLKKSSRLQLVAYAIFFYAFIPVEGLFAVFRRSAFMGFVFTRGETPSTSPLESDLR